MGTRHLICIYLDGEYHLAQYGQWDGYPSGQGAVLADFLDGDIDLDRLKTNVRSLTLLDNETIKQRYLDAGVTEEECDSGFVPYGKAQLVSKKHPEASRDCGAGIVSLIYSTPALAVPNKSDISFAQDSLFCEWAYVIDLDRNVLEVYAGFTQEPHEGQRFSTLGVGETTHSGDYHPVRFVVEYSFDELVKYDPTTIERLARPNSHEED